MYVLIHKGRVLVGPRDWNRAMFDGTLEDLGIKLTLPRVAPEDSQFPIVIDSDTRLALARLVYPEYNSKIEYIHGPFWDFSEDVAVGTFEVKETPVELIKSTLKAEAANQRYNKENSGTIVEIQQNSIKIDTTREVRNLFAQKAMTTVGNVNFKFSNNLWLSVTKAELESIISAIDSHVQAAFDWEFSKVQEIDNATTSTELNDIVIIEQQSQLSD